MKIYMSEPDGPYGCEIDPGVMDVKLTEVFKGVEIKTTGVAYQESLHISMRDNGFEVRYITHDIGETEDDEKVTECGFFEFKDGRVTGPALYPRG